MPVSEAVAFVHTRGAVVVVAHPALNLGDSDTEALAREGLDGIEVWHPSHGEDQRARLLKMTSRLGILATGGSDFHGPGRNRHEIASSGVAMSTVQALRERAFQHRSS